MMQLIGTFNENSWLRFLLNATMTSLVIFAITGLLTFLILVWFAARRMRAETEQAYDDCVLNAGYQLTDYAQHLVEIVHTAKIASSISRTAATIVRSSRIGKRIRMILAENLNRRPFTKATVAVGLFVLTCCTVPMGAMMRLAEADNQENALYQEIQSVSNSQLEPLAKDATEADKAAWQEDRQRNMEGVIALCDKFLNAFPKSERYDEIWYDRLIHLRLLGRHTEFAAGVEKFLSELSSSEYADKLYRLRAYRLESQYKLREALAEWDKIDDPTLLHKVYERKGQIYGWMNNQEKQMEYDVLRAELILGKPAPAFSHPSVYGAPVSLSALRGKVVVLYHWSTRDGRTVRDDETGGEITKLKRLYAAHNDNPNFVLICVCTRSSESKLREFVNAHAMPGIHLILKHEEIPHQFGFTGWPYYVVYDKAGILRESVHGFELFHLEIEQLVVALLAEDINPIGDRIIPRISKLRAKVYSSQNRADKTIAEYEKLLAFIPNNLDAMLDILDEQREPTVETAELMNRAYHRIVELSRLSPNLELDFSWDAIELAKFFSRVGAQEKTWKLFQIAVEHRDEDFDSATVFAKQYPEGFAILQDMSEFQKLLADAKQTVGEKGAIEGNRKRAMYADEFSAAYKSFTAVEADNEIFTGVILTQDCNILVPAIAAEAEVIRVKIGDYHPATVVAVDAASGLAVVHVDVQQSLRPVVLGNVDDLRDYALVPLPDPTKGYSYPGISVITARGYSMPPDLPLEIPRQEVGTPITRDASVMQLDIEDDGKVAALKVVKYVEQVYPGEIIRGDATVYYDGRLLAVSLDKEVQYDVWGATSNPIPIDRIRAALERMNMIELMDKDVKKEAETFE